jgi:hypothetical protein
LLREICLIKENNKMKSMKELHPDHCKALEDASLSPTQNLPLSRLHEEMCSSNLIREGSEGSMRLSEKQRSVLLCWLLYLLAYTNSQDPEDPEDPEGEAQHLMAKDLNVAPSIS